MTQTQHTEVTERSNYVYFDIAGIEAFSFIESSYSISSGQPYSGIESGIKADGKEKGQGYILVKAGRHKTEAVASWFKSKMSTGQTLACDSSGTYPKELNFAVQGTLTITTIDKDVLIFENIIIAQGNFDSSNNWWIGSPTMQGVHLSITGLTIQWCKSIIPKLGIFTTKTPCVNHFNIGLICIATT